MALTLRLAGPSLVRTGLGARAALAMVEELESDDRLAEYQYLPAIKADLLERLGCTGEAAVAYRQAMELTRNEAERQLLAERLGRLRCPAGR